MSRLLPLAAATLAACARADSEASPRELPAVTADTFGATPLHVRAVRVRANRNLVESSAAAVSVAQPAIIFTINDSGHEPVLFAIDTTGAGRGAWRITAATNVDWEAAAFGPCAPGARPVGAATGAASCIYIGEVGDNDSAHERGAIYRVAEPSAESAGFIGSLAAEQLIYRYADGPRDVEAMYVAPDGTVNLITKRPLRDAARRLRPALIYSIPPSAWSSSEVHIAHLTDSLAIIPGSAPFRQVTDAALSPDSRFLAVRTYLQVYIFATDTVTGAVRRGVPPTLCNIGPLDERQGEGIGWVGADRRLVLTSEGHSESMHIIACSLPGESVR